MRELTHVTIYTDGACAGNPGPGGYAAVLLAEGRRREITGGRRRTTNNRMELLAAVEALACLKWPCRVTLRSDSRYLIDGATGGRAARWRLNADLWGQLLDLCEKHAVTFEWVRGHAGDPENDRCDRLAEAAARGDGLPADAGYEAPAAAPAPSLFG